MAETCGICPHECLETASICGKAYGLISSVAIDPIEKKPLYHFHPGRPILSVGGFGCNLKCPFCQNHQIAMAQSPQQAGSAGRRLSPEDICAMAKDIPNNIGLAYTYNEPLINYEFVLDCARLIKKAGMCNVLVSNGFIKQEPLKKLLPFIDAMNIDLKGFTDEFYKKLGGALQPVKDSIALASRHCHVEVTTLVIPGENESHIEPIAQWLAGISPSIPYHISRFFPRHQYSDKSPTPLETIHWLCDTAKKYLKHVYHGNI